MRIALAQQNYHIGHFEKNFEKISKAVIQAQQSGTDLVLFSELAVCGYPPRDFLEFSHFIEKCWEIVEKIKEMTAEIAVVIGCPTINPVKEGKDLFNSAVFLYKKEVVKVIHKTLLPTYDIFDEYRYFEPNSVFETVEFKGKKIAITICEDIWNLPIREASIGNENPLYKTFPVEELSKQKPDLLLNLSASPFDVAHAEERIKIVEENARRYALPIFYCNATGAQTEVVFDGGSLVASPKHGIVRELPYFEECLECFDLDQLDQMKPHFQSKNKFDLIERALIVGVKDYFNKLGFKKAIVGLSGGVDSALTLYLAVKALGKDNVLSVLMPSQFSSDHSVNDAIQLTENLGSPYELVAIKDLYDEFIENLHPYFKDHPFDVTEENIQARIRGVLLMAFSNKFGYILLNTSNKSEAAVGYGTLYGDMCGGLSVIGDVYKTDVFDLCKFINRNGEIIPENIITKPPSAELRPNQKDADSLPEYDILDPILKWYIEGRKGPKEIINMGYDEALVRRVLRLVNRNEYKRYQTAPMIRVGTKAFGMGRRMPIVARYLD